jgi:hypothetical protein
VGLFREVCNGEKTRNCWPSVGLHKKASKARVGTNADEAAVGEQIQRLKQLEIISLFGKIDFHPNYDYKFERRRKRTGN